MTEDQENELIIAMNLLRQSAAREQQIKLIVGSVLVTVGLLLLLFFFEENTLFPIAGLTALAFGIHSAYAYFTYRDLDRLPLFQTLKYRPKQIVWIYAVMTERMPFGFKVSRNALMYFKLIDGQTYDVKVSPKRAEVISAGLNHLLPHTTFGYTEERELRYQKAPATLLREIGNE